MKKLIALVMVLALASAASAAVELGVSSISIDQTETATISILTDDAGLAQFEGLTWVVTVDAGTLSGGEQSFGQGNENYFIMALGNTEGSAVIPPAGENGVYGSAFALGAGIGGNTKLIDGITFQPAGLGVATIRLYEHVADNVQLTEANMLGEALINVVPEPMTFGLLGLGGLFLRRRRA